METNRIRQFCTIAETQNLRKAAEMLNISHGGLFKSLKVLEDELGFELFTREGRGIVLSDKGRAFLPRAKKFLLAHAELLTEQVTTDEIRIGTFEVFSTYFFSSAILGEFPTQDISLKELVPGELESALLTNKIDIGITYEPIPTQGIDALKIGKCKMGVFAKKEGLPFVSPVIPVNSVISGVKGLDGWPDHKIPREIKYKVDMLETALQMCSQKMASGFFPRFVVDLYNQKVSPKFRLEEYPAPKGAHNIFRDIYILKRKSSEESREIKKIAKVIRNSCY